MTLRGESPPETKEEGQRSSKELSLMKTGMTLIQKTKKVVPKGMRRERKVSERARRNRSKSLDQRTADRTQMKDGDEWNREIVLKEIVMREIATIQCQPIKEEEVHL